MYQNQTYQMSPFGSKLQKAGSYYLIFLCEKVKIHSNCISYPESQASMCLNLGWTPILFDTAQWCLHISVPNSDTPQAPFLPILQDRNLRSISPFVIKKGVIKEEALKVSSKSTLHYQ